MTSDAIRSGARAGTPFALIFFFLSASLLVAAPPYPELFFNLQNDSAMRLVSVRDLLAGQAWFDLTQYRLGPAGGVEMHWSRLIDACLSGLILVYSVFAERALAEYLTLVTWPLAMLGLALWLSMKIMDELASLFAVVAAILMAGVYLATDARFQPGNIDHHAAQVVLLQLTALALIKRGIGWPLAVTGGFSIAASIAIGVEFVPLLAFAFLILCALWVARGNADTTRVAGISFSIAAGLAALFLVVAPRSAYVGNYCDALSIDLVGPVVVAAVLLGLSGCLVTRTSLRARLGISVGIVAAATATAALFLPACLSNPLDRLDPRLKTLWLDHVTEASGLFDLWDGVASPLDINLFFYPFGALALVAALAFAWFQRERRAEWLVVGAMIALAFAVTVYQIRGTLALKTLMIFPLAALAAALRSFLVARFGSAAGPFAWLLIFASLPTAWGLAQSLNISLRPDSVYARLEPFDYNSHKAECLSRQTFETLAALPSGTVSASWYLGPDILQHTRHRVLSAPYHRNQEGMRAQFEISLARDAETARRLIDRFDVDYLMHCRDDKAVKSLRAHASEGFAFELQADRIPAFLERVESGEDTGAAIWKVLR